MSDDERRGPLRIGNGLITGSAHPDGRSVTSMDVAPEHSGVHARPGPTRGSLDVPSGLQPDIMENHDEHHDEEEQS